MYPDCSSEEDVAGGARFMITNLASLHAPADGFGKASGISISGFLTTGLGSIGLPPLPSSSAVNIFDGLGNGPANEPLGSLVEMFGGLPQRGRNGMRMNGTGKLPAVDTKVEV